MQAQHFRDCAESRADRAESECAELRDQLTTERFSETISSESWHSRAMELESELAALRKRVDLASKFDTGGAEHVLRTYLAAHEGKVGAHWAWVVVERLAAGEPEIEVMLDYGYVPEATA